MNYFLRFFKSELTKFLYERENYIIFLLPLLLVFYGFIVWITATNAHFQNSRSLSLEASPWFFYYRETFFLMPAIYVIISTSISHKNIDLEHRRRMWKYIFAVPKAEIYLIPTKQLTIMLWLFLSLTIGYLFTLGFGFLITWLNPSVPFKEHDCFFDLLALLYLKLYLFLIPIILLHTYISLFFRFNILLSVLAPCFIWLTGIDWIPHNIPLYQIFRVFFYNGFNKVDFRTSFIFFDKYIVLALLYSLSIIIIGQFLLRKNIYKIIN